MMIRGKVPTTGLWYNNAIFLYCFFKILFKSQTLMQILQCVCDVKFLLSSYKVTSVTLRTYTLNSTGMNIIYVYVHHISTINIIATLVKIVSHKIMADSHEVSIKLVY